MNKHKKESIIQTIAPTDDKLCHCEIWSSRNQVLSCFNSAVQKQNLVQWLSSSSLCHLVKEDVSIKSHKNPNRWVKEDSISSHQNLKNPNYYRINASFWILNSVRDACRGFLSPAASDALMDTLSLSQDASSPGKDSYDSAFPSLPGSSASRTPESKTVTPNVLMGRKKPKQQLSTIIRKSTDNGKPSSPLDSSTEAINVLNSNSSTSNIDKNIPIIESHVFHITNQNSTSLENKKEKRRIRPNTTAIAATKGNISNLPSEDISIMTSRPKQKIEVDSSKKLIGPSESMDRHSLKSSSPLFSAYLTKEFSSIDTSKFDQQKVKSIETNSNRVENNNGNELINTVQPHEHLQQQSINVDLGLNRIADVYSTIIINHLIPSTILELHFLIRLLSLPDDANRSTILFSSRQSSHVDGRNYITSSINQDDLVASEFNPYFLSGRECRIFAAKVISSLTPILSNLGNDMMEAISSFPPMKFHLPEVCLQLHTIVVANKRNATLSTSIELESISLISPLGSSSSTASYGKLSPSNPILALPFHPDRDSKHNYRSISQAALFKNREECRDVLFSKIRAFQNVYAKILDPVIAGNKITEIENAAKTLIHEKLLPQNMFWFAEIFCDLLLKIGLEDVEETDVEILSHVKDGTRLQVRLLHHCSSANGSTHLSLFSLF